MIKNAGDLIKAFRNQYNITQEEMAAVCKIAQANLSAIEKGSRSIGPSLALKIAAFMGVSPLEILYPNGYIAEREYQEVKARSLQMAKLKGNILRSPSVRYGKIVRTPLSKNKSRRNK